MLFLYQPLENLLRNCKLATKRLQLVPGHPLVAMTQSLSFTAVFLMGLSGPLSWT